jgi:phospholipid/cholesterol/gamma-HCH transport system substrate-binding protein
MGARMRLQIKRYGRSFVILLILAVIGTAAGFYILLQQRLPNPFQTFYSLNAAFPSAAAVVPGLGEPVNVAGVRVGQITGTSLKDGQGVVHMTIDPHKIKRIYRNASADLVPNTPLKDMQINIHPGDASAGVLPHGGTIPLGQTTTPIDADDLLSALDTDTRSWFTSLITDLNEGTSGRGTDIRALLNNLGPTMAQLRQIGDLLAARRHELALVVHNLGVLTKATTQKDAQLQTAIQAGNATIQALASQDVALRDAIVRLPGTLAQTRTTLRDTIPLANALGPTATALIPTARRLPGTLRGAQTLFEGAALLPLAEIPPFVRAVLPLATQLTPLVSDLNASVPSLIKAFKVLNYTTNELAYVPGGNNPGMLYWLAWAAHDLNSFLSTGDAHGAVWRGQVVVSCSSLGGTVIGPLLSTLLASSLGC